MLCNFKYIYLRRKQDVHWIYFFPPHLCVGFLFLILYPAAPPPPPPPPPTHLCQPPSFTHNLSHTSLPHIFVSPHLCRPPTLFCHTPSFTHNHLSHTSLSTTIFHTQSFTHIFVNHHLSHTYLSRTSLSAHIFVDLQLCFVTHHLSHTTICHTHLCQPPSFTHIFDMCLGFASQAWHLETSTFVLRGGRGTYGTGLVLVARLDWITCR